MMDFEGFRREQQFAHMWNAVRIERAKRHSLFTFGESRIPYYLICEPATDGGMVQVTRGEVRVTRPAIITPGNCDPEFHEFFESQEEWEAASLLLSRTAGFSNLKLHNHTAGRQFVSDQVQEVIDRLNRQLDAEEDEEMAILTAPAELAGMAILRYTAERIWESVPHNIQELRERGFLDI